MCFHYYWVNVQINFRTKRSGLCHLLSHSTFWKPDGVYVLVHAIVMLDVPNKPLKTKALENHAGITHLSFWNVHQDSKAGQVAALARDMALVSGKQLASSGGPGTCSANPVGKKGIPGSHPLISILPPAAITLQDSSCSTTREARKYQDRNIYSCHLPENVINLKSLELMYFLMWHLTLPASICVFVTFWFQFKIIYKKFHFCVSDHTSKMGKRLHSANWP